MLHKADALYCLNVKLCVKPERREEFLACIANNQRGTLGDEPLAVTYLFGEDEAQPNTFQCAALWHEPMCMISACHSRS